MRLLAFFFAAVLASLASCYSYQHYTEDPTALDYLFFGAVDRDASPQDIAAEGGLPAGWSESEGWQFFALWGLVPWHKTNPTFAAEALALHKLAEPEEQGFTIETGKSPLNVLAEGGLGLIPVLGFPFFLNWRSVRVSAQPLRLAGSR